MTIKLIIFWVLMLAFIIPGYVFGFQKILGQKQKAESFNKWNYPLWFMRLIGLAEVGACTGMLFTQTRYYAISIFAPILIGAVYTHLKHKESNEVSAPVFVGLHVAVIFVYALWLG